MGGSKNTGGSFFEALKQVQAEESKKKSLGKEKSVGGTTPTSQSSSKSGSQNQSQKATTPFLSEVEKIVASKPSETVEAPQDEPLSPLNPLSGLNKGSDNQVPLAPKEALPTPTPAPNFGSSALNPVNAIEKQSVKPKVPLAPEDPFEELPALKEKQKVRDINNLKARVQTGTIDYERDIIPVLQTEEGKKELEGFLNEYGNPESISERDGKIPFNWNNLEVAIKNSKLKNRAVGVGSLETAIVKEDLALTEELKNLKYQITTSGITGGGIGGGGMSKPETFTMAFKEFDPNDVNTYAPVLDQLQRASNIVDATGKKAAEKDELIKTLLNRKALLVAQQGLKPLEKASPEMNDLDNEKYFATKIEQATYGFMTNAKMMSKDAAQSQKDVTATSQNIRYGLEDLKTSDPAKYKNILASLKERGQIAEPDFERLAEVGQQIRNTKTFLSSGVDPNMIDKESNIKYLGNSYESKRAIAAGKMGEWLKENSSNKGQFTEAEIKKAAAAVGVNDKEILKDIIFTEKLIGMDGIPKSGIIPSLFDRGVFAPVVSVAETLSNMGESQAETYLRSNSLLKNGLGADAIISSKGEVLDRVESDKGNVWYSALEGLGQFATQVVLTRGAGGVARAGGGALAKNVLGRATTSGLISTSEAAAAELFTGTFVSTYMQEYGSSYDDAINKTGDVKTARTMAALNSTAASLFELVLPDAKVAESIMKGFKSNIATSFLELVNKGGDPAELLRKGSSMFAKFGKEYADNVSQEIFEELGTNLMNVAIESVYSPNTVGKRDIGNEVVETIKATAIQTSLPGLLAGVSVARRKDFTVQSLNDAALDIASYKRGLDNLLSKSSISQDDYNSAVSLLETHRRNIFAAPEETSQGERIPREKRLEYAVQQTSINTNKKKLENKNLSKPEVNDLNQKIKQAEDIQESIFNPTSPINTNKNENGNEKADGNQETSGKEKSNVNAEAENEGQVLTPETSGEAAATPEVLNEEKPAEEPVKKPVQEPVREIPKKTAEKVDVGLQENLQKARESAKVVAEELGVQDEKLTKPEETQWAELSRAEKLKLAKQSLPEVEVLPNIEVEKIADENAKVLLAKLNNKNQPVQEPVRQSDEITVAETAVTPFVGKGFLRGMNEEQSVKFIAQQAQDISVSGEDISVKGKEGEGRKTLENRLGKDVVAKAVAAYPRETLLTKKEKTDAVTATDTTPTGKAKKLVQESKPEPQKQGNQKPVSKSTESTRQGNAKTTAPVLNKKGEVDDAESVALLQALKPKKDLSDIELNAMKGNPTLAYQMVADQALGFGRVNGERRPIPETSKGANEERMRKQYGDAIVDRALKLFPLQESEKQNKNEKSKKETNSNEVLGGVREEGNENEGGQEGEQLRSRQKEMTVAQLRAEEQKEVEATDPNDKAKLDEIYNRYDKLITPKLEQESQVNEPTPTVSEPVQDNEGAIQSNNINDNIPERFTAQGGNKAVDEKGQPIVLYHGTKNNFNEFDNNFLGANTGANSAKEGFFFSSNKDVAISYASESNRINDELLKDRIDAEKELEEITGNTAEAYTYAKNRKYRMEFGKTPEEIASNDEKIKDIFERINKYLDYELSYRYEPVWTENKIAKGASLKEVILEMKNPLVYDFKGEQYGDQSYTSIIKNAKDSGNDSVILKNTYDGFNPFAREIKTDIYIVFDKSQIKSNPATTQDVNSKTLQSSEVDNANNAIKVASSAKTDSEKMAALQGIEAAVKSIDDRVEVINVAVRETPEQQARNSGEKIVDGKVVKRQSELKPVVGKSVNILFSKGDNQQGNYVVIEASQLQPSHKIGVQNELHFIPEAQPRDRGSLEVLRNEAKAKSDNLDVNQLGINNIAYYGAPVVNVRGEVIQGNGRSEAIDYYYNNDKTDSRGYKKMILDSAKNLNLNVVQIRKMKNPVLVKMAVVNDERAIVLGNYKDSDLSDAVQKGADVKSAMGKLTPAKVKELSDTIVSKTDEDSTLKDIIRDNAKVIIDKLIDLGALRSDSKEKYFKGNDVTPEAISDAYGIIRLLLFDGAPADLSNRFDALPFTQREAIEKSIPAIISNPQLKARVQDAIAYAYEAQESGSGDFNSWRVARDMFADNQKAPSEKYDKATLDLAKEISEPSSRKTASGKEMTDQKKIATMIVELAQAMNGTPATLFDEAKKGADFPTAMVMVKSNTKFSAKDTSNMIGRAEDFEGQDQTPATVENVQALFPDAIVVQSQTDLPQEIQDLADERNIDVEGVLHTDGNIYMVVDNIPTIGRAEGVYRHERIGHKAVIDELAGKVESFASGLVDNATTKQKPILENLSQIVFGRGVADLNDAEKSILGQEYIAIAAENPTDIPTVWNKITSFVKDVLRDLGINVSVSDNDVKVLLDRAKKSIFLQNEERRNTQSVLNTEEQGGNRSGEQNGAESTNVSTVPQSEGQEQIGNIAERSGIEQGGSQSLTANPSIPLFTASYQQRMAEMLQRAKETVEETKLSRKDKKYLNDFIDFVRAENPNATSEDVLNELDKRRGVTFTDEEAPSFFDYIKSEMDAPVIEPSQSATSETAQPEMPTDGGLKESEASVIREVINRRVSASEFPGYFQLARVRRQQTALTQEEGQGRKAEDGLYLEAALDDLRIISIESAKIIKENLGKNWKEKTIRFFEANPFEGDSAQISGIFNIISTEILNELKAARSSTRISELSDLQKRMDLITYDVTRSAALTLNQRRLYTKLAEGKPISDVMAEVVLTPDQVQMKERIEEALKKKFTDAELNTPKRKRKPSKAKSATTDANRNKNTDVVKNSIIDSGFAATDEVDANGEVKKVTLAELLQRVRESISNFEC